MSRCRERSCFRNATEKLDRTQFVHIAPHGRERLSSIIRKRALIKFFLPSLSAADI
jgi:hypothetical protein